MDRTYTVAEARALLPELRAHAERVVALRADLAEASASLRAGDEPVGGLAQAKSLEAHLQEQIDWFADHGIQVKGIAPLIVDFPIVWDGEPVLLCWLEGEERLEWYHPADAGFMGRRRLPEAPEAPQPP